MTALKVMLAMLVNGRPLLVRGREPRLPSVRDQRLRPALPVPLILGSDLLVGSRDDAATLCPPGLVPAWTRARPELGWEGHRHAVSKARCQGFRPGTTKRSSP